MSNPIRQESQARGTSEGSVAVKAAAGEHRGGQILAPLGLSDMGAWCYDRIKRSTGKVTIVADMTQTPIFDGQRQFQLFVDRVESDSLLQCAVLEHRWDHLQTVFKNGSMVDFHVEQRNL